MLRHRLAAAAAAAGLGFLSGCCMPFGHGEMMSLFNCRPRSSECCEAPSCGPVCGPACDGAMMGAPAGPVLTAPPPGTLTPQQTVPPLAPAPRIVPQPAPGQAAPPSAGL